MYVYILSTLEEWWFINNLKSRAKIQKYYNISIVLILNYLIKYIGYYIHYNNKYFMKIKLIIYIHSSNLKKNKFISLQDYIN